MDSLLRQITLERDKAEARVTDLEHLNGLIAADNGQLRSQAVYLREVIEQMRLFIEDHEYYSACDRAMDKQKAPSL